MPIEPLAEPPGILVPVQESVLKGILQELKSIRSEAATKEDLKSTRMGIANQFDILNERLGKLEKAHADSGFEYRVLRDAIDHARVISLRVEDRLNSMDEMDRQRKIRSRQETLHGTGDPESPTNPRGMPTPPEPNGGSAPP